jgi:tRNA-dihydrouridine synthase B
MAPLRGITDDAFRDAFHRHFGGFDRALAPFLNPMARGGPRPAEILRSGRAARAELPATPQALTADADDFLNLARRLADVGCRELNWNLGCPHLPVVRRRKGAGMLPHPEQIDRFLDRVAPTCPLAISVKMRLGLEQPGESLAVLAVLDGYPLVEITIHARLGVQMYEGVVDLEGFEACLGATRHPVIYNGDIIGAAQLLSLARRFPTVQGWMIGRGALCDPSLPARIKGATFDDLLVRHRRLHDDLYRDARDRLHGAAHVLGRMKGIWAFQIEAFGVHKRLFKKLRKAVTLEGYEQAVDAIFAASSLS